MGAPAAALYFAEYCAWYVICTWLHYWHTGDQTFAAEFEPVVDRAMQWLCDLIGEDGLMEVGVPVGRGGGQDGTPGRCCVCRQGV